MLKHIPCDCKCKVNSVTCNSNQKWNNDIFQDECKNYSMCKKDYNWNPSTCICENSKHRIRIVDDSVILCDEIPNASNSVSTNVRNTILTYVTSTMPIDSDDKTVRYNGLLYSYYFISNCKVIVIISC